MVSCRRDLGWLRGGSLLLALAARCVAADAPARVTYAGYPNCVRLDNGTARVTICPQVGCRVLEYALGGRNVLHLNPAQDGWVPQPGKPNIDPTGGRMDIGPETRIPGHPALWYGPWQVDVAEACYAKLSSVVDGPTGVQLIREFRLDPQGSHLRVTQTIWNATKMVKHWCHWSRTLALNGGIAVVPLNPDSRFPRGYLRYGPGSSLNWQPEADPKVQVRDACLVLTGPPTFPKYGLDTTAGWLAYYAPNNVLFVKRFPVYPNRVYSELAGFTVCLYYEPSVGCELEPLGPREDIAPARSVSFSEDWYLADEPLPTPETLSILNLREKVQQLTDGPKG